MGTPQEKVGGPCEGCEAIWESPVPFERLPAVDTLPDFSESGPKMLLEGVVYAADGKTPRPGVVVYAYHTDQKGIYPHRSGDKGWGLRHGYLRGWVKTDARGRYRFYTLRPAAYPNRNTPAHIHLTVKEPQVNEYYIDDVLFDDDPLLTKEMRRQQPGRGGSGIVPFTQNAGIATVKRPIYLGRNIPHYAAATGTKAQ